MRRSRAGLPWRTASRSLRVSGRSSSSSPATANSSERSRLGLASACAPTRWASAVRASSRAVAPCARATIPAPTATHEQDAGPGEQAAQAAVRPALAVGARARGLRRRSRPETRVRSAFSSSGCACAQSTRGGEPGAAVEVGRPPRRRPPTGGRRCRAGGAGAGPRGPRRASARSVGHSRISASWATSAVPSPRVTRRASARRSSSASTPRATAPSGPARRSRTRRRVSSIALAELGQAQEQAARQRALLVGQRVDDRVGGRRDRRGDAAALAVALEGQRAPVAALPGGAQRVREQRQGAGLAGDVAQHELDQAGLEPQARRAGPAR